MREIPELVCWHEGMELLPQHLQLQSLRAETLSADLAARAHPLFWGVNSMDINEADLPRGRVCVTGLDAVMPDGMLLRIRPGIDAPLQLDLATLPAETLDDTLDIQVAVAPLFRGHRLEGVSGRYRSAESEPVSDLTLGENAQSVPVWRPDPRLCVAGNQPTAVTLQLLRLQHAGGIFQRLPYAPPSPIVHPESPIGRTVNEVCAEVQRQCLMLANRLRRARHAGGGDDQRLANQLATCWSRQPELKLALESGNAHPADLYLRLVGLCGALCGIDPLAGMTPLPAYQHCEALACFQRCAGLIHTLLARLQHDLREYDFIHDEKAANFALELPPEIAAGDLHVALYMPTTASEQDVRQWMNDVVIASASQHPQLLRQRVLGLARRAMDGRDAASLAYGDGVMVFALEPDARWIVAGEPLLIAPPPGCRLRGAPRRITLLVPEPLKERETDQ